MNQKRGLWTFLLVLVVVVILAKLLFFGKGSDSASLSSGPLLYLKEPVKGSDGKLKVEIYAKEVTSLAGAQMSFRYDPEYLVYERAEEGTFLKKDGAMTFFFDIKNSQEPGLVSDIVVVRQGAGVDGDGHLATIYFDVKKAGTSRIDFNDVLIADQQGNKLAATVQGTEAKV